MTAYKDIVRDGLWSNNVGLVQLLGLVGWVGQVVTGPQPQLVGQLLQGHGGQGLDVVELIQNL